MRDITNQYELRILIKGRPVAEYAHTDGYTYVEGRGGSEYELELVNHSYERILMIPSVDGLSVLNGKPDWSDGYVVNASSSIRVPGWRRDNTKVAAFEFADARDSYTSRVGNGTSNVGVIGLMVHREKINWNLHPYVLRSASLNAFDPLSSLGQNSLSVRSMTNTSDSAAKASAAPELGTGWGEDTAFQTTGNTDYFGDSRGTTPDLGAYNAFTPI